MSFKIQRGTLHFWKPPNLICLEPAIQDNISAFNAQKLLPNITGFLTVSLLGVFTFLLIGVPTVVYTVLDFTADL